MPAAADSSNLRELLRSGEDDAGDARPRDAVAKLTLAAVLGSDIRHGGARMSRTLLDIIRDESPAGRPPCDDGDSQNNHSRTSFRIFLERLRLRLAGASFASSVHAPPPVVPVQSPPRDQIRTFPTAPDYPDVSDGADPPPSGISLRSSNTGAFESAESTQPAPRQRLAAALAAESEVLAAAAEEESSGRSPLAEAPARMSLMALLEEADRQMRGVMPSYAVTVEEGEEGEEDGEESDGGGGRPRGEFRCCVCMVRHKGAAFIPCGHTFCRRCSRELWVSRGSCPTCNVAILEILDIF